MKTNDPFKILNSIQDRETLKQIYDDFMEVILVEEFPHMIKGLESRDNYKEDVQMLNRIYNTAVEYASGDGKNRWPNYPAAINEFIYLDRKMHGIQLQVIDEDTLLDIIQKYLPDEES